MCSESRRLEKAPRTEGCRSSWRTPLVPRGAIYPPDRYFPSVASPTGRRFGRFVGVYIKRDHAIRFVSTTPLSRYSAGCFLMLFRVGACVYTLRPCHCHSFFCVGDPSNRIPHPGPSTVHPRCSRNASWSRRWFDPLLGKAHHQRLWEQKSAQLFTRVSSREVLIGSEVAETTVSRGSFSNRFDTNQRVQDTWYKRRR